MKKYQSIKRIDLLDRESLCNYEPKNAQFRLHSLTRSSQRSISRDIGNQYTQCFTDRNKNTKVNEFNMTPSSASLALNSESPSPGIGTVIKSNIKTYIRFKPFTKKQLMDESEINNCHNGIDIVDDKKLTIDQNYCFTYDKIFTPQASQRYVYQTTSKQLVNSFVKGYNGTIFAYGQTGSGKTYTMFGQDEQNGIIPQVIEDLFIEIQAQKIMGGVRSISLSCSMFEIYKENICDLMNDRQKDIKIKENSTGNVQIENLTIKEIASKQQLFSYINKGSELRKIRETEMNERSSRSHLIFTLYLNVKVNDFQSRVSKLNLVDLAGSEKVSKTKVSGEGLEEAIKINLSLSCLGNTINALCRGQEHVPFRDSKLTRVLQQSLSGNSITRVIVTCSMLPSCKDETISSLKFANRIKKLKTSGSQNVKKLTQQGFNKFMYQTLKIQYQSCEQKLEKIRSLIQYSPKNISKEEILDCLKAIINTQQKSPYENQFLPPYSPGLQTFLSPNKEENISGIYQNFSTTIQKSNGKNTSRNHIDLLEQIRNLETIVVKQQKIIQSQSEQLEKLRKNGGMSLNKTGTECKKRMNKLKILKTNHTSRGNNGTASKSHHPADDEDKENNLLTFRNRFPQSTTNEGSNYDLAKDLLREYTKQKLSYENMEKQILSKQVKALGLEVNQLRRIIQETGHSEKISKIPNFSGQMLSQKSKSQQSILNQQLQQKDSYILHLQRLICQKIKPLETLNHINKKSILAESLDYKNNINITQSIRKSIDAFVSPTSSTSMTRINSMRALNKFM